MDRKIRCNRHTDRPSRQLSAMALFTTCQISPFTLISMDMDDIDFKSMFTTEGITGDTLFCSSRCISHIARCFCTPSDNTITSPSRCQKRVSPLSQISGSESFTKWLVWGASTSAQELGKIRMFLCSHHLQVHKVQNFFTILKIRRSPPPPTILGQKPKATTKVILTSHKL